jgi:hypothetical protein
MITGIINSAYSKMDQFLTGFQPILEIYWKNKKVDLQILVNERLRNPIEGIANTIRLFNYHNEIFSQRIPTTADIGLIQIDSKDAREKIQPTPKRFNAEIEKFIPSVLKERNIISKKWLQK